MNIQFDNAFTLILALILYIVFYMVLIVYPILANKLFMLAKVAWIADKYFLVA